MISHDAFAHLNMGNALKNLGKFDAAAIDEFNKAIDDFNKFVAINPRDASAHGGLGRALLVKGNLDAAIDELKKAIAIDPHDRLYQRTLDSALADKARSP